MRNIAKGREPQSLERHRCAQHADYGNYAGKDELRQCLVTEQRGLCCYCMQRIRPPPTAMKVEHWQCQDCYPERQLDYTNLLGACRGGEGNSLDQQHCDTRKGDADLTLNPADPAHDVETLFRLPGSGRIEADDEDLQRQLDDVLNLNVKRLRDNRKAVLDGFRGWLQRTKAGDTELRRQLRAWNGDGDGELREYCQVVVYYLRRKLGVPS